MHLKLIGLNDLPTVNEKIRIIDIQLGFLISRLKAKAQPHKDVNRIYETMMYVGYHDSLPIEEEFNQVWTEMVSVLENNNIKIILTLDD